MTTFQPSPARCEHIFCDNRAVDRAIATHKVIRTFPNGHVSTTRVCAEHLDVMKKVLRDNDIVEAL